MSDPEYIKRVPRPHIGKVVYPDSKESVNEYNPWEKTHETELDYYRRKFLEESFKYDHIVVMFNIQRAALMLTKVCVSANAARRIAKKTEENIRHYVKTLPKS